MTYPIRTTKQMAKFLDIEESIILTRIDVLKMVWNYIKINNLINRENRKQIIPNKELSELFRLSPGQTLNLYTLLNHITYHIKPYRL
jgi:chromatin remodeling complex protein RSC6